MKKCNGFALYIIIVSLLLPFAPVPEAPAYERRTPVVDVYEKNNAAVVNIAGRRYVSTSGRRGFDWFDSPGIWGPRYRRQVAVLGSGIVVHEDGFIITNSHVIKGAEKLKAVFSDGREFSAEIINADESKDLAVLRIQAEEELPFIKLGRSNDLMIGETVVAIGNPFGYQNTVSSGVISAVSRDIQIEEGFWLRGLIQTDAAINPGNSGGPLLNINGLLIGINTAIRAEAQNIGFAIPVDTLAENLREMLMPEELRRVQLGLVVGRRRKIGPFEGLEVLSVNRASPAAKADMTAADVILEIDGHKVSGLIDFYVKLMNKEVGEPILVKYARRDGNSVTTGTAKLAMQPRPLPDGRKLIKGFFEMQVSELTDRVASEFGFESSYPVLIVTDVVRRGVAHTAGIRPGDLILEIGGVTVRNYKELALVAEQIHEGNTIEFRIMRISMGQFGQIQRQFMVPLKAQEPGTDPDEFL